MSGYIINLAKYMQDGIQLLGCDISSLAPNRSQVQLGITHHLLHSVVYKHLGVLTHRDLDVLFHKQSRGNASLHDLEDLASSHLERYDIQSAGREVAGEFISPTVLCLKVLR